LGDRYIKGLEVGDRSIIEEIYSTHLHYVIKWVSANNGDPSDARDVFQEALTQLLISSRKGKLKVKSSFASYLMSTCKYLWLAKLKKSKRINTVNLEEATTISSEEINMIESQEKDHLLHHFLESNRLKLSETCRKLLALFSKKVKTSEIVRKLNMTNSNTLYRRKFACMKKWRALIEEDKSFYTWKELEYGH